MPTISATLNLGTVSPAITSVKLLSCPDSSCTGGTLITGYDNVSVSTFPRTVSGIPDTAKYIKVEGLGDCSSASQCIKIDGLPGNPITPTPTATGTPTPTPTATPTPTPACVTSVSFEVDTAGEVRYVTCCDSTEYVNVGIGPQVISDCVQINSLFSTSASIRDVVYSQTSCSCNSSPTPINFSVSPQCVGYPPTGITITVSSPSGGSGTGYYVVMTSPEGLDTTHYSLPHNYTGLNNYVGNTYAFSVFDSIGTGGNKALTEDFNCAAAPNNTAYVGLVVSSIKPTSQQCTSASKYSVELNSPSATFCNATTFTNSNFQGLTTGNNYWLCYDGQARQMFHPSNAGYFQQAGGCQTI